MIKICYNINVIIVEGDDFMVDKDTLYKIASANFSNPYADIIPYALGVGYPVIYYNGFILQNEEVILYATPASIYNDKEKVVGYKSSSSGVSFRVAKGVSIRKGSSRSNAIRRKVREYTDGDLIITNKRVAFLSSNNGFDIKIDKITAVRLVSENSFILQSGSKSKNIFLNGVLNFYTFDILNRAIDCFKRGVNIFQDYLSRQNMLPEHQQLCVSTRQQIATLKIGKTKSKVSTVFSRVCLGILAFFVIIVILALNSNVFEDTTAPNSDSGIVLSEYSDKELVLMKKHPKMFDDLESAKSYVDNLNDSRVNIVYTNAGVTKTIDEEEPYEDAVVTYDLAGKYVGCFNIDIKNSKFSKKMKVEDAVKIAESYLPAKFKKSYKCDSSYIVKNDVFVSYTYSTRLNEKSKATNKIYPNYLSLYIVDYKKENRWVIKSDYSAYGGKDKGWIEKYATPWIVKLVDKE